MLKQISMRVRNQAQLQKRWNKFPRYVRGNSGMALLGVMLVLMLILAIALIGIAGKTGTKSTSMGALGVADASVTTTGARMRYYGALSLADTGIRQTLQWMSEASGTTLSSTGPFYPDATSSWSQGYFFDSTKATVDTTNLYKQVPWDNPTGSSNNYFAVKIYPYSTNAADAQQKYIIESVGFYNGTKQIVRVAVRQDSFATYALFLNNIPTYVLSSKNNVFGGPVHINGNGTGNINILWKDDDTPDATTGDSDDQIFKYHQSNAFTTSAPASSIAWYRNSTLTPSTPTGTDLNYVFGTGAGMQTGAPAVTVPSSTAFQTQQQMAAYGGTTTAPASTTYANVVPNWGTLSNVGVSIPTSGSGTTGGVVIQGQVDDMVFSTQGTPATTQVVTIYQNQTITVNGSSQNIRLRTTVTIDRTGAVTGTGTGGTTTVAAAAYPSTASGWVPISTTSYNGTTSGIIYDRNSNIGSTSTGGIHGTIADNLTDNNNNIIQRNSLTVATSPSSNLYISGSVLYNTKVTNSSDAYEAVGNADKFKSGMLGIVSNLIEINQKGYNAETKTQTTKDLNNVEIDGIVFAFNTFDAYNYTTRSVGVATLLGGYIANSGGLFGQQDLLGNLVSGFRKANNYDDRVLDSPPPAFPNSSNSYVVTSYQRVTQTLDTVYNIN